MGKAFPARGFLPTTSPAFDPASKKYDFDPAKKIEAIKKAEKLFSEDAPMWFFNYNKAAMAHQPWVHGLAKVAPKMMFQDLVNVWVDENSPRANTK